MTEDICRDQTKSGKFCDDYMVFRLLLVSGSAGAAEWHSPWKIVGLGLVDGVTLSLTTSRWQSLKMAWAVPGCSGLNWMKCEKWMENWMKNPAVMFVPNKPIIIITNSSVKKFVHERSAMLSQHEQTIRLKYRLNKRCLIQINKGQLSKRDYWPKITFHI